MDVSSFFVKKTDNLKKLKNSAILTRELLLDVVDNSSCMLVFYSEKEGWIGANKLFFDTFALKDIADFINKHESIRDIFISDSDDVFMQDDMSWLDYIGKNKKDGHILSAYNAANEILTIKLKCQKVTNKEVFYLLELEDITKLKRTELEVKEIERLKLRFLANIGHEFRTPMNGILGFIELLAQTSMDQRQMKYLQMISRSSLSLMSNIDTILDYSQMQSGKLTINNASFFLLNELEQLIYTLYVQAKDKKINILAYLDPRIPQELIGDARKVKQIMNSLVQNCIKFTERGGRIIIEVKLAQKIKNGECNIVFSVKDNGLGIINEQNEQMVCPSEPFSLLHHADERLGVGLSLSYGLTDLLGSKLELQSEKGHGTYFKYLLNFKVDTEAVVLPKVKKRVKVLLLDNSMVNEANLLSLYLYSFGLDVVKTDLIDKYIYNGIDALYVVTKQYDSSWVLDIGIFIKKAPIILLVDENEPLQSKLEHIVDEVIRRPLLPNQVFKHIQKTFDPKGSETALNKTRNTNTLNVLIVEDNIINQKLLQILLQKYNFLVSTAIDGNEAVEKCEKNSYDIVFMDIDLPNKNGIVATKEIKAMMGVNKETPFIALTAMAMDGDKEMLISEGLDDYISKPISLEKLESMLNKYLNVTYI